MLGSGSSWRALGLQVSTENCATLKQCLQFMCQALLLCEDASQGG